MAFSMEEVLNFCVYGCAGLGVAVLVAVRLPYTGMDFTTYHIHTFFYFVLTWHPPIPAYDSGTFYDVPDYSRQHPDYSHYSHGLSDLMLIMLPYSALLIAQSVSSGCHVLSSYTLTHCPPQ